MTAPAALPDATSYDCGVKTKPVFLLSALILLCLPYVALAAWLQQSHDAHSMAAYVASVIVLMLLTAMLAGTWRRFLLLQLPFLLLSAAFAVYTAIYDVPPGSALALVLATSTWDEVRGFFSIWPGEKLLLQAVLLVSIYLLLAGLAPSWPISSQRVTAVRWGVMGTIVLMIAFAAQSSAAFMDGLAANPVVGTALFVMEPLRSARAGARGDLVHKVAYGASRVQGQEVHIMVIGESARRDSWSAYGYGRKTTPCLEALRGEAILFQNAVADANLTAWAVPIMLTGMHPDTYSAASVRGNLVDLAREAGYSTAWLMNQDIGPSMLVGMHADRMGYPPTLSSMVSGRNQFDESLLPGFDAEIRRTGQARFIGLHIMGSHWQYQSRYPAAFAHFDAGRELKFIDAFAHRPDQGVVNAYDNSIAYTDWLLGQVIERARKLTVPATVTYFSDHGEDLYGLDGQAGHGTAAYSRHQFEIPAFVWFNSAYRAAHPDKVQATMHNAGKEIRSHNAFYSVADLMGIQWPGAAPAESFASRDFVPDLNTRHIAGGKLVSRVN